jgi:hypothetical protein
MIDNQEGQCESTAVWERQAIFRLRDLRRRLHDRLDSIELEQVRCGVWVAIFTIDDVLLSLGAEEGG